MLKKTSNPPVLAALISLTVLVIVFLMYACRKMDRLQSGQPPADRLSRFFAEHPPASPGVKVIADFMKRQNAQSDFINTIVDRVGYPRWNKAFAVAPSTNAAAKTGTNDNLDFYFIPFVRDSQEYVNACLIIKAEGKDTSYKWLCDWQYKSTSQTGISKRATSSLLMQIDHEVFGGHRKYLVKDTSVLDSRGSEVSVVGTPIVNALVQARSAVVEVCVTYQAPVNGWLTGCPPGSTCNPYQDVTQCFDIGLTDDPGWNDNIYNSPWSGGIPTGGGGGGGWTPPVDPCAPYTYNGRVQYPPGCSGPTPTPWIALIDDPFPYGFELYDSWWVSAEDEVSIAYWESNNIDSSGLDSC